ncbi:MAG TPA: hypothetical protein VM166_13960, partial [Gemmatimonadaceae bacterium]|nr:hypothetical protein [Gemmatimonadaceae bacterium]
EGLVDIRERGGVYVRASLAGRTVTAAWPTKWLAEILADGLSRGIAAPDLAEMIRRSTETMRLRVAVISSTDDQAAGLARELREDFGLYADGISATALAEDERAHRIALNRSDLLIATRGQVELVQRLAAEFQKPCITIDVRTDFMMGEWALLLRQPLWVIVATAEFGEMLRRFMGKLRGIENLHVLVHGIDDLEQIPANAATYVTHRVRDLISGESIRGRVLPAARTISRESAVEIFSFIVRSSAHAVDALAQAHMATEMR